MTTMAFSPDGHRLAGHFRGDSLRIIDVLSGTLLWSAPTDDVQAAFAPDGKTLVTGGWDNKLSFRDAATGKVRMTIPVERDPMGGGPGASIDSIAFSQDGKTLATTHYDGTVRVWDPETGTESKRLKSTEGPILSARFSPDEKWIVSGGMDHTVRLWEVATGKEMWQLVGHDGWVTAVEFGFDGRTVVSAAGTEVMSWDLRPKDLPLGPIGPLWDDLLSADSAKAYRAIWALADRAKEAASFFREKIQIAKAVDPDQIAKLIAELNSDQFTIRAAATKSLEGQGLARRRECAALEIESSPESKRRLRSLLDALKSPLSADDLRRSRAVQVLELPKAQKHARC